MKLEMINKFADKKNWVLTKEQYEEISEVTGDLSAHGISWTAMTLKEIKEALVGKYDSIGKNKLGEITVRRGFYYRHGCDSDKYREAVSQRLTDNGINHALIDAGEHLTDFRGGASIRNQSHWYVTFKAWKE